MKNKEYLEDMVREIIHNSIFQARNISTEYPDDGKLYSGLMQIVIDTSDEIKKLFNQELAQAIDSVELEKEPKEKPWTVYDDERWKKEIFNEGYNQAVDDLETQKDKLKAEL